MRLVAPGLPDARGPCYDRGMGAPRSAGMIALLAAAGTLAAVVVISTILVVGINPGGDMFERGRLVGAGAAQLSLVVGLVTYLVVKLRRRTSAAPGDGTRR